MGQKIYAQRDIPVDGRATFKAGEVFIEMPEGVSLQVLVTAATAGMLGEDKPAPVVKSTPTPAAKPNESPKP
jgi:hypothetical protein